jgi:excisionase family DNA binding protein
MMAGGSDVVLYRIRDAATLLSVSPRMVHMFIASGELPVTRLPSTGTKRPPVRIARADMLAFVERRRGQSA